VYATDKYGGPGKWKKKYVPAILTWSNPSKRPRGNPSASGKGAEEEKTKNGGGESQDLKETGGIPPREGQKHMRPD